jgi:hypothetical protein
MTELIDQLRLRSEEFTSLWNEHEVAVRTSDRKRIVHPMIGSLGLDCQTLIAPNQAQILLVYTATPGTEDYDKLQLLSVIGTQKFQRAERDGSPVAPLKTRAG